MLSAVKTFLFQWCSRDCSAFVAICNIKDATGRYMLAGMMILLFLVVGKVHLCTTSKGWILKPSRGLWLEIRGPLSLNTNFCTGWWMHRTVWTVLSILRPDSFAAGHVSILVAVSTMDELFYTKSWPDDTNHVDLRGKFRSSSALHGWTFQWRWSSDATTSAAPSSDISFAAAECSARSTTCNSSCISYPPAPKIHTPTDTSRPVTTTHSNYPSVITWASTTKGSTWRDQHHFNFVQSRRDDREASWQLQRGDGRHLSKVSRIQPTSTPNFAHSTSTCHSTTTTTSATCGSTIVPCPCLACPSSTFTVTTTDQGPSSWRQDLPSRQPIYPSTSQSTSTMCNIHSFQAQTPTSLTLTEIYLSSITFTGPVTFNLFRNHHNAPTRTTITGHHNHSPAPTGTTSKTGHLNHSPVLKGTTSMVGLPRKLQQTPGSTLQWKIWPIWFLASIRPTWPTGPIHIPLSPGPSSSGAIHLQANHSLLHWQTILLSATILPPTQEEESTVRQGQRPTLLQIHDETLQEGEIYLYLSNLETSHEEWISQVQFALHNKSRVKAACALPEDKCPQPPRNVNKSLSDSVTRALSSVADGSPSHKVQLVVHVLAGAGLLEHINLGDVKKLDLPSTEPITKKNALVIPVPDLPRFKPRPPFGGKTSHTWALIRGTSVTAAQCILLEGLIRPADWMYNPDLKQSQRTELRRRGRVSFQCSLELLLRLRSPFESRGRRKWLCPAEDSFQWCRHRFWKVHLWRIAVIQVYAF